MKYRLRILPAADADVDAAALYIAQDNLEAAMRFYDAVDQTYQELSAYPERWPSYKLEHPRLAHLRKRAVAGFRNYLVFYHLDHEMVEIIRVLHGARDLPAILQEI